MVFHIWLLESGHDSDSTSTNYYLSYLGQADTSQGFIFFIVKLKLIGIFNKIMHVRYVTHYLAHSNHFIKDNY